MASGALTPMLGEGVGDETHLCLKSVPSEAPGEALVLQGSGAEAGKGEKDPKPNNQPRPPGQVAHR